jgi:glycosyltransferase involved in cell wall biosynthesis
MKALCIHPSSPKGKFQGSPGVDFPDTQLYGYNHLASFGIDADLIGRDDALPGWLATGPLGKLIGFRLRHLLLFFKARSYDLVFGSALLYLMPLKKVLGGRARYVLFNIELIRILRANAARPVRSRLLRSLLKEFSAIVCLSHAQQRWLAARYPFLTARLYVVPLGVDTEFYHPTYEGRDERILAVGSDGGRDYATLLAAAALMPQERFEIVCSPHNLPAGEAVPPNVTVHYNIPFSELTQMYQRARMLVLSTHDDSYLDGSDCSGQTVLLDAMANGLPVVASRKQYLADYLREDVDALLIEPYQAEAIVSAITRLTDPILRDRLARSARVRAATLFSTRTMAEGLARVFGAVGSVVS